MSTDNRFNNNVVIDVRGVSKRYRIFERPQDRLKQMLFRGRRRYFQEASVLHDLTFQVHRGETVGIVGRNGAGKSTLLQMITGTIQPSDGEVLTRGRIAPLIELGSGFSPELTGRENIFFNGMVLGMTQAEVEAKFDQIAAFADIGPYIERPVKTYSSGMYARLAFAVAIHVDPDILIVDEILSVGDAAFQRKCMARFYDIRDSGCTILIVAHDEYLVRSICQKCLYLKQGRMVAYGGASEVVGLYMSDLVPPAELTSTPAPHSQVPEPAAADSHAAIVSPAGAAKSANVSEAPPTIREKNEGPVYRITDVHLLGTDGHPMEVVPHDSTVTLEFGFEALATTLPPHISFVFNLHSVNGTYVCGSTTLMERMAAHPSSRRGRVRINFPNLKLLAGKYIWRVAINDGAGLLVLAEAKHACPFRVTDDYRSAGTVHLDRSWQIDLDAPADRAGINSREPTHEGSHKQKEAL
jgi:lipopolysaccharide transport system ATP-binding protein